MQERRNIGETDRTNLTAFFSVVGSNLAGRCLEIQAPGRTRADQPVFYRDGYRSDDAVSTHPQAAGSLNEQYSDIAVIAIARVQDAA